MLAFAMPIADLMSYNDVMSPDVISNVTKENVLQDSHTRRSLDLKSKVCKH